MMNDTEKDLELMKEDQEMELKLAETSQNRYQTNPIVRKLLDFSSSNKTRKFSVRDLMKR